MPEKSQEASLTPDQARQLLLPVGDVVVEQVDRAATINDVFEVKTREHGTYYVKFHTARWYEDQPDTFFVVNRECAVHEILRKRGMALPYRAWGDYTRCVVPRSVFICGKLPGISVPDAVRNFPQDADSILTALGRYMRRLHDIRFSVPGLVEPAHAYFLPTEGRVPPVVAWPLGASWPARCQAEGRAILEEAEKARVLRAEVTDGFRHLLDEMPSALQPFYDDPRLVVGNCHAHHFHVERCDAGWEVVGLYDFEAAQAGDPTIDLVELAVTLTPRMASFRWRKPLFAGYGSWPNLRAYKMRLLTIYLLAFRLRVPRKAIPDPDWLDARWLDLIRAETWDDLIWYPVRNSA